MDVQFIKYEDYFVAIDDKGKWTLFDTAFDPLDYQDYIGQLSQVDTCINNFKINDGMSVIVFITESCNLRCDYCKVMKMITSPNKKTTQSIAIVNSLLKCLELTSGTVNVTFYGGEPLIKYESIDEICEILSLHSNRFQYAVTTNGTRFNDGIATVLKRHRIVVGVSMDASQAIHDMHRNYINSNNTHALVSLNYLKMKNFGIECGPIAVVTDPSKMLEMFEYFVTNFDERFVYLKPLDVVGNEDLVQLKMYFDYLLDAQLKLLKNNIEDYASGKPRRIETYTQVKLKNILLSSYPEIKTCKNSMDSNCTIDINIKGIEPDGNLLPCPTFKMRTEWDETMLTNIKTKGNYCKGCNYSAVCTSFCMGEMHDDYIDRFLTQGDRGPLDVICSYNRRFIDSIFKIIKEDWSTLNAYVFK